MVRNCLLKLFEEPPDIHVIGDAGNGYEAVKMAMRLKQEVVFMDRGLPDMSGLDATRLVLSSCPEISVSGLSMHEEEDMAASMIKAGAVVYLTKRGATCPLISTIRASATTSTSKAIIRQNNAGRTLAAVQLQAAAQQELRNFVIQVY